MSASWSGGKGREPSAFARRVLAAVRRIPAGLVATYGDIAAWPARPAPPGPSAQSCASAATPTPRATASSAPGGRLGGFGGNLGAQARPAGRRGPGGHPDPRAAVCRRALARAIHQGNPPARRPRLRGKRRERGRPRRGPSVPGRVIRRPSRRCTGPMPAGCSAWCHACWGPPRRPRTCCRRSSSAPTARWAGFRGESSLGTWLYRIAVNHCLDHLRSRGARMARATESLDQEEAFEPAAVEPAGPDRHQPHRSRTGHRAAAARVPRGVHPPRRGGPGPSRSGGDAGHLRGHLEVAGAQGADAAAAAADARASRSPMRHIRNWSSWSKRYDV